jgi:peptidoglycan-associated lipoprotein
MPTAPSHSRHARSAIAALLALTTLTTGTACRRRPTSAPVTPAAAAESDAERVRREADEAERQRRAAEEAAARARAEQEAGGARGGARAVLEAPVYFSFDRSDLEAQAREALEAKLGVLRSNPAVRVRIIGHTDDRGSDEYNLALGQRRAAAAKRFLTQREIDTARIEIASVGEEQGVCADESESCWSRNRRAEFVVTAGTLAAAEGGGRRGTVALGAGR